MDKDSALLANLRKMIEAQDRAGVQNLFASVQSVEAVRVAALLSRKEQRLLILLLSAKQAADVVESMERPEQMELVKKMTDKEASDVIGAMESNESAELLRELPQRKAKELIDLMAPDEAKDVRELISYPENTVGGLMSKEFISFSKEASISEVLNFLRDHATELDQYRISYVYVLDGAKRLTGVLRLRDLILKNASLPIEQIMIQNPVSLPVTMLQKDAVRLFQQHQYLALPVVDDCHALIGIVTSEDIQKSSEKDAAETFLKFTGIAGGEELRTMPLVARIRNRLSWLSVNVFLNIISASVIACFQDTLKAIIALSVFLPIISDMSGCSGNQAVAVSIRELTLGRISLKQYRWILGKEFLVGLINGMVLGLQVGLVAYLWKNLAMLGVVVALALWINTVVSVIIGGILPVLINHFRMDPAIVSAPILTTITDSCGFFIILSLARIFLPYLTS